jgi:hypothetical protein
VKPAFTVHIGEYLAGWELERHGCLVWIPSKDTGIDFLVTDMSRQKTLSLQVKYSQDYSAKYTNQNYLVRGFVSRGWYTFSAWKMRESQAELWMLVLHSTGEKPDFIFIDPRELRSRLESIHNPGEKIQSYLCVTKDKQCWETRGLRKREIAEYLEDGNITPKRDFTTYLNRWDIIKGRL